MPELSRRAFGKKLAFGAVAAASFGARAQSAQIDALRVTVLSTMLAENGTLGEWGFSALVEMGPRRFLFDTGAHTDVVLQNAKALKLDLASVQDVVLSHNHPDHVGGLVTLRRELMKTDAKALSVAHIGGGIFQPRYDATGADRNGLSKLCADYEATGGVFRMHDKPEPMMPAAIFTGPVPRPHPEHNWRPGLTLSPGVEDNVPEDSAVIFDTPKGLVVLTGCGHAGIVNICEYARAKVRNAPLEAVIGGLHVYDVTDETIGWTAAQLKSMGMRHLLAAHCTGIESTYKLRAMAGLDGKTAKVAAVGSIYDLDQGINAGSLVG